MKYINYTINTIIYTLVVITFVSLCIYVFMNICYNAYVEIRINFMSPFSLSTMSILGKLNSHLQAWWQVPSHLEPSHLLSNVKY